MMRRNARRLAAVLCVAALQAALQGAVLRGLVLDNLTGRPLARTLVTLRSLEGYATVSLTVRTDRAGVFTFPPVDAGAYLLAASRPGYATVRYGQKAWNAPGTPFWLEQEGSPFLQLRPRRLAAITGTVWDENEIGFPEQDVVVYSATRPPKLLRRTKTDDRGIYRLGMLEPGRYLVRTMAKRIDDETGLLPTFHKEVATVEEAAMVQVGLEEQASEINVRPLTGNLCRLSGTIYPPPQSLLLVSDMGELAGGADSMGQFSFENLAPGEYELIASGSSGRYPYGAWQKITLERDMEMKIGLVEAPGVQFVMEDREGKRVDPKLVAVFARRTTLAGAGPAQRLREGGYFFPGRWEMSVSPPPDFFPLSITVNGRDVTPGGRAAGWHEFQAPQGRYMQVRVTLSSKPAGVHGRVLGSGNEPAAGAPVWLEAIDANTRKRLWEPARTLTDAHGEYRFAGLSPGTYRLLSTFDVDDPDEETMEAARPKEVVLQEAAAATQDLALYIK
jgi:hypothetical protein